MDVLQGKSLSVICGALRWLVDSEQRDREAVERTLSGGTAGSGAAGQAKEHGDDGAYVVLNSPCVCLYLCCVVLCMLMYLQSKARMITFLSESV